MMTRSAPEKNRYIPSGTPDAGWYWSAVRRRQLSAVPGIGREGPVWFPGRPLVVREVVNHGDPGLDAPDFLTPVNPLKRRQALGNYSWTNIQTGQDRNQRETVQGIMTAGQGDSEGMEEFSPVKNRKGCPHSVDFKSVNCQSQFSSKP